MYYFITLHRCRVSDLVCTLLLLKFSPCFICSPILLHNILVQIEGYYCFVSVPVLSAVLYNILVQIEGYYCFVSVPVLSAVLYNILVKIEGYYCFVSVPVLSAVLYCLHNILVQIEGYYFCSIVH